MAQNKQETKREKREAARKARIEAQKAKQRARKRKRMIWLAVALVVVVGASMFFVRNRSSSDREIAAAAQAAGCGDIQDIEEMESADHIQPTDPTPDYNSSPPTSGPHLGTTAPWGSLDEKAEDKLLVHNLEHGGIIIHHNGLSDEEVDEVTELADSYADGVISQPNEEIESAIALTAWGTMRTCDELSVPVVQNFISEHCNKGPEKLGLRCG